MFKKDNKRRIAYEIIIFLLLMALLCFITRIWVVLFLVLIGILIAALRLLYLSSKKVEIIEPKEDPEPPVKPDTEQDVLVRAYGVIQRRITESVQVQFPAARWVWANPNALKSIEAGTPVHILLNGAGGFRKALVQICNLQFRGLEYITVQTEPQKPPMPSEDDAPVAPADSEQESAPPEADCPDSVNYEYLAFEWVEANLMSLNDRANEMVARGQHSLLVSTDDLPDEAAWQDICAELVRSGFDTAMVVDTGIQVNLPHKDAEGK